MEVDNSLLHAVLEGSNLAEPEKASLCQSEARLQDLNSTRWGVMVEELKERTENKFFLLTSLDLL
jgi:hypothetical protein